MFYLFITCLVYFTMAAVASSEVEEDTFLSAHAGGKPDAKTITEGEKEALAMVKTDEDETKAYYKTVLPRSEDTPYFTIARARARFTEMINALHEHQQLPEKKMEEANQIDGSFCAPDKLPAANAIFTTAIAEQILKHYKIPYCVKTGYMYHPCLRTESGKTVLLYCWLVSPAIFRPDEDWPPSVKFTDEDWEFPALTDICLTGFGAKQPQVLGQMMGPDGSAMVRERRGNTTSDLAIYSRAPPKSVTITVVEPEVPEEFEGDPQAYMRHLCSNLDDSVHKVATEHIVKFYDTFKKQLAEERRMAITEDNRRTERRRVRRARRATGESSASVMTGQSSTGLTHIMGAEARKARNSLPTKQKIHKMRPASSKAPTVRTIAEEPDIVDSEED